MVNSITSGNISLPCLKAAVVDTTGTVVYCCCMEKAAKELADLLCLCYRENTPLQIIAIRGFLHVC